MERPHRGRAHRPLPALGHAHLARAHIHAIRLARLAALVVVALGIVSAITGESHLTATIGFLFCVLLIVSVYVILRRVLGHERVGIETILGALCVYIIIGLMFTFLFISIARLSTTPFLAQPPPRHEPSDYLYLSFVTLTTVGFGDLTPASKLARSVVVLEALVGQVFLVTLVATTGGSLRERTETHRSPRRPRPATYP